MHTLLHIVIKCFMVTSKAISCCSSSQEQRIVPLMHVLLLRQHAVPSALLHDICSVSVRLTGRLLTLLRPPNTKLRLTALRKPLPSDWRRTRPPWREQQVHLHPLWDRDAPSAAEGLPKTRSRTCRTALSHLTDHQISQ